MYLHMHIVETNPDDYNNALISLRSNEPIVTEQFYGLVGQTMNGRLVFVPSSYRKGYSDALLPVRDRPYYTLNLIVIGQLSDGSWVFPPSYDNGIREGLTDLKFSILAQGEKRLFNENQKLIHQHDELRKELERAQSQIKELKDCQK